MKAKILFSALLLVLIMSLSSCGSVDENLRAMVPDDAAGVVVIDVPSILSKGGMLSGEAVQLPSSLKSLIDESAPSVMGDVVYNMAGSGIDFQSKSYVFFSPGIFKVVALIPLSDTDAAARMIAKIADGKMTDVAGLSFASHLDYAYVIDDDVLLIGRYSTPVDNEAAATAASAILDKKKPSLFAREEADTAVSKLKGDIVSYIDVKALGTVLKTNSRLSTIFGYIPLLEVVTDSDIKAMTMTLNFDVAKPEEEKAEIATRFIYADNGQYSTLYDNLIMSAPADTADVTALIPGELETYMSLRVDGAKLLALPQMEKMEEVIAANAMLGGLDVKAILNGIRGNLVVGLGSNDAGAMNFAIATQSPAPHAIVQQVISLANNRGQRPMQKNGEYVYDYGRQGIAMGESDNTFYLYCADFEPNYPASELPLFPQDVAGKVLSVFTQVKAGNTLLGYLNWGLSDKSSGDGLYYTDDPAENIVVSLLKYLCWADPVTATADGDDYDYGF